MTIKKDSFIGQEMIVLPDKAIKSLISNPLTNSLFFTDMGYFPDARHHYRNRNDGSIHNILIYCVEGKGWVSINGKRRKIGENQYCIIPRNIPHSYAASEENPWTIYWFHFSGSNADFFIPDNDLPEIVSSDEFKKAGRIILFKEILTLLRASFPGKNLEYANYLFGHLLATFSYEDLFKAHEGINENPVNRAISYMRQNLNKKIRLEEIATHCGFSVSHLSLIFKKQSAQPPMEYLNSLRIQEACHLLDQSSKKIKEVATEVGFSDALYFSRLFTKVMGRSPRQYREVKSG